MAKKEKAKRGRPWSANEKLTDLPKWDAIYDTAGKVKKGEFEKFIKWVYQWARDVHEWGADARDDIIRLEGQAGFSSGDPGDPPDGPPDLEDE